MSICSICNQGYRINAVDREPLCPDCARELIDSAREQQKQQLADATTLRTPDAQSLPEPLPDAPGCELSGLTYQELVDLIRQVQFVMEQVRTDLLLLANDLACPDRYTFLGMAGTLRPYCEKARDVVSRGMAREGWAPRGPKPPAVLGSLNGRRAE